MSKVDVGKYLGREFSWRSYNCWDFTREVWLDVTGVELGMRTPESVDRKALQGAFDATEPELSGKGVVSRIPSPIDPCIVLMVRPRVLSHVGIFVQHRVLHLVPKQGVFLQDFKMATMGFSEVRYYK